MANGIYSAVSGAVAQTKTLDTVANNLANVSTTGFKAERISFAEVLAKTASRGRPADGSFVKAAETRMDFRQGALQPTERKLDVALEGPGFLCLQQGRDLIYSRGGTLRLNTEGILVDAEGHALLDQNNKVLRPGLEETKLTIDPQGAVKNSSGTVGQLKIVEFDRPARLTRLGQNVFAAPATAARPSTTTVIRQGHLEKSNVNAVTEISSMILASRAYETLHRVISTYREIDTKTATELAKE